MDLIWCSSAGFYALRVDGQIITEIYNDSGERYLFHEDEKDNLKLALNGSTSFRHELWSVDETETASRDVLIKRDNCGDVIEVRFDNVVVRYPNTPESEESILRTFFDPLWVLD
jgi:hypothetical protein